MDNVLKTLSSDKSLTAKAATESLALVDSFLDSGRKDSMEHTQWHEWLRLTSKPEFLQSLGSREQQYRWAEIVFKVIRQSDFTLESLLVQRTDEHPDRVLFQDMSATRPVKWTYKQILHHVREIATVFYKTVEGEPRVAIFSENSVESACCDIACLCHDILDTPLNIHFNADVLAAIFDRLNINIAVTDTEERRLRLEEVREKVKTPFTIFVTDQRLSREMKNTHFLGAACKRINNETMNRILDARTRRPIHRVATVMFTSGSTGLPKGVSFSIYHLVTKRFARGAALPAVGHDEVLLCYLPLFHTFGRYFEMLGAVYWRGTYVFAGNPSAATLLSLFPSIHPTGFISIPLRWVELFERAVEKMDLTSDPDEKKRAFREAAGSRLRWGLSAAGYLDQKIFHFFNRNGVALCSGFGMTEGTGGLTMTPPGEYRDDSNGIPLPGTVTRFTETGELEVGGHYVARYLEDIGPGGDIPFPGDEPYWLPTGDIFRIDEDGYYGIVDRVKDIYKNNKGQTVAPRKVEKKFEGVPGIKRTFLVGDGRPYNVLFIVPDRADPVFRSVASEEDLADYFHQIITSANQDLAPYERVINYTLLDRDFEADKKELTPKGSYNRKTIEANFSDIVAGLYQKNFIQLEAGGCEVRIPRWFYRDLGILEDDIQGTPEGLRNRNSRKILPIGTGSHPECFRIGDLEYKIASGTIDLGLFARQPRLWIGNPALIGCCPIKEGWDLPLGDTSPQVFRASDDTTASLESIPRLTQFRDFQLDTIHRWTTSALFSQREEAAQSVERLSTILREVDDRKADVIRRRLEALADHPEEDLRCAAYRILLLDEPTPDYSEAFPSFILSGKSFLNENSIESIAFARLESRRLDALRRRLFAYRMHLDWPVGDITRQQFVYIFELLKSFVDHHPEFYTSVRSELAAWILHKTDPDLAAEADRVFTELASNYEARLEAETPATSVEEWNARLVFDDGLAKAEINRIRKVLIGTTFLKQSIMLAFGETSFDLADVIEGGIWISRILSSHQNRWYRMSINTAHGKHYNLLLVVQENLKASRVLETVYWLLAIAGYPYDAPVLPRLGCYRPALGARSVAYVGELTAWTKIRQLSLTPMGEAEVEGSEWRKLYVRAASAFFRGWANSGYRIVPGSVTPNNVVVPEADFRENVRILSLTGWTPYKRPLDLIKPVLRNFYFRAIANYPACREHLHIHWIFDACVESLGREKAMEFFESLKADLKKEPLLNFTGNPLADTVEEYIHQMRTTYFVPLSLQIAVDRYRDWERLGPKTTNSARESMVVELYNLYRIARFEETARYYLYRHTYFKNADASVLRIFDRLIERLTASPETAAVQTAELSDLQSALTDEADREVFSRLVFPSIGEPQKVEVVKVGEGAQKQVIVQSEIADRYGETYTFREPVEPVEIGRLYRLFFEENYPLSISEQHRHFIAMDAQERIVGGIAYVLMENAVARIDGIVVTTSLKERGIGSALLADFENRMLSQGINVLKTLFYHPQFFIKHGFKVDERWGALVKIVSSAPDTENDTQG